MSSPTGCSMRAALSETMFLGADTIKPLLQAPGAGGASSSSRPRFSTLPYTGAEKAAAPAAALAPWSRSRSPRCSSWPRRSAASAAARAVVMGALSPRARNAQVGMFQAGEVDYLVATDAIGMGLNMDLDHVAFAKLVEIRRPRAAPPRRRRRSRRSPAAPAAT